MSGGKWIGKPRWVDYWPAFNRVIISLGRQTPSGRITERRWVVKDISDQILKPTPGQRIELTGVKRRPAEVQALIDHAVFLVDYRAILRDELG